LHKGETVRDGLWGRISIGITANDHRTRRLFVIFVILIVVLYTMTDKPDRDSSQLIVPLAIAFIDRLKTHGAAAFFVAGFLAAGAPPLS